MRAPLKLGRFRVSEEIIRSNWPTLVPVLKVVVVDCRPVFLARAIEYTAFGEMFEELAEGAVIPEYVPTFTPEPDGTVTVEWKCLDR